MPGLLSDILAWVVIGTFVAGVVANGRDHELDRRMMTAAWMLFALFWLQLIPHFTLVHENCIEGLLTIAAVPVSLYANWLLYNDRDTLLVPSRAVAAMGVVCLPFETIPASALLRATVPAPRGILMGTIAVQTRSLIRSLGYTSQMIVDGQGCLNTFLWMQGLHQLEISVVLTCTDLGGITIFIGLIAAVSVPIGWKLRGLTIAVPIICALNLLQTTFIAISVSKQYFHLFVDKVLFLFGSSDPYMVSLLISDRVISQALAIVALVGVTYLVVHKVPELLTVIEDVLYTVTDDEYDLRNELGLD